MSVCASEAECRRVPPPPPPAPRSLFTPPRCCSRPCSTGKFSPIFQWFYLDAMECLPKVVPADCAPVAGSRYAAQELVFGQVRQLSRLCHVSMHPNRFHPSEMLSPTALVLPRHTRRH